MAVTVEQFKEQISIIKKLREEEEGVSAQKKDITKQLETQENKMLAMLDEAGVPSFKCDLGNVGVTMRMSIKTPKTPEDRALFFGWLKSKGLFDDSIVVHSATLNSLYKSEMEAAKERGEEDFKIPGLLEETLTPILWFRKT